MTSRQARFGSAMAASIAPSAAGWRIEIARMAARRGVSRARVGTDPLAVTAGAVGGRAATREATTLGVGDRPGRAGPVTVRAGGVRPVSPQTLLDNRSRTPVRSRRERHPRCCHPPARRSRAVGGIRVAAIGACIVATSAAPHSAAGALAMTRPSMSKRTDCTGLVVPRPSRRGSGARRARNPRRWPASGSFHARRWRCWGRRSYRWAVGANSTPQEPKSVSS